MIQGKIKDIGLLFFAIVMCAQCRNGESVTASATLFKLLKAEDTGVTFANTLQETEEHNIIQYLYFYNGAGVALGDINNDGLTDIYFASNQGENKLYLNKGAFRFEDITTTAGVAGSGDWSTGVTITDVNGDGLPDIYVCQVGGYKWFKGRNLLYINNGDLTFSEKAKEYGLGISALSTQASFFDYDRDGDLDMYLLCHSVHSSESYAKSSMRSTVSELSGDRLLRNDGDTFADVSEKAGIWRSVLGYGLGISTGDINNDGWPDIYISNDFHENDYLYYNNGDGTFTDGLTESIGHTSYYSMGNDIADINNDGKMDIVTLDMKPEDEQIYKSSTGPDSYDIFEFKRSYGYHYQYARNALQLNMGRGGQTNFFSEIGQLAGVDATDWSWSALFADFDLNGWKDLYITNGILRRPNDLDYLKYLSDPLVQKKASDLELAGKMPSGEMSNYCYSNSGNLLFTKVSSAWGLDQWGISNGAAYADLDNDGDLDLAVNNINNTAYLLQNTSSDRARHHFIKIRLTVPDSHNPFGIGSRVTLYSQETQQVQELFPVKGFMSSVGTDLVFGLGDKKTVDSIVVRWPDGLNQKFTDVKADHDIILKEEKAQTFIAGGKKESAHYFADISERLALPYRHHENDYIDMVREKLMPHMLSTEGPRLAKGDVNNDGLEDFFAGGARGQAASLFIQQKDGTFISSNQNLWIQEKAFEDIDAAFFDADKDGDADLYVVSAGNEFVGRSPELKDRLYLNDGHGNFMKAENNLPDVFASGSCIEPFDFDNDGDMDVFVGSRGIPYQYGASPESYLMENDGHGVFTVSPGFRLGGMVTDACWSDLNRDGRADLIVVGEWMPVTIMYNEGKVFKTSVIKNSSGWWNVISEADLDNDGDMDFMLGNFGLNSSLTASPSEALTLYLNDFDKNLSLDPVMTYFRNGKEYPYVHKDELVSQLTPIKRKFVDYKKYALSSIREVIPEKELQHSEIKRVTTLSSVCMQNNGDGTFGLIELPREAQFSPVESILIEDVNHDDFPDAILGGNFYECQPSIGRSDACYGWILLNDHKGGFRVMYPDQSHLFINGQVRDMKQMILADGNKIIIIARNNEPLQVFLQKSEKYNNQKFHGAE